MRGKRGQTVYIHENIEARPITSRLRTGRCFLIDTFEEYTAAVTEKWVQDNGTIALATTYPKQGKQCMTLTTGDLINEYAVALLSFGVPFNGRFGVELEFMIKDEIANIKSIEVQFGVYNGSKNLESAIKYLGQANLKWQYFDENGDWSDIPNGDILLRTDATELMYHNLKLIVDFVEEKYVKLIIDNKVFDMNTIAIEDHGASTTRIMYLTITIYNGNGGANRILYVDNVILTDNEP